MDPPRTGSAASGADFADPRKSGDLADCIISRAMKRRVLISGSKLKESHTHRRIASTTAKP
jgi:hypothetical protein